MAHAMGYVLTPLPGLRNMAKILKSKSFEPIARADARVLILGSLPGKVSLERGEYYAQPRNNFWRIMGELTGAAPDLPYQKRLRLLKESRIAVWDVCAAAHRPGSLDSSIQLSTVEANSLSEFLQAHRGISLIGFNGKKTKEIYDCKVAQEPPDLFERIRCEVLPSSSPANASIPYEQKLLRWRTVLVEGNALGSQRSEPVLRTADYAQRTFSNQENL
jgi:double-stranded uracil-DNA glycosylase